MAVRARTCAGTREVGGGGLTELARASMAVAARPRGEEGARRKMKRGRWIFIQRSREVGGVAIWWPLDSNPTVAEREARARG